MEKVINLYKNGQFGCGSGIWCSYNADTFYGHGRCSTYNFPDAYISGDGGGSRNCNGYGYGESSGSSDIHRYGSYPFVGYGFEEGYLGGNGYGEGVREKANP